MLATVLWAVIKDGDTQGMIFFHGDDDSAFVAKRVKGKKGKKGD